MKIDYNPLQMADAHYMEPEEVNMVEVIDDFDMTKVTEDFVNKPVMVRVSEHLDQGFFHDFVQEAMENFTNGNTNVFNTGITEDSNLVIVTNETADGFAQIDKATKGLQLKFQNLDITEDVEMEVNMVEISQETSMEVDNECQQEEYNKVTFPKEDETLTDFLWRCQKKQS